MKRLLFISTIVMISFAAKAQSKDTISNSKADSSKFVPIDKQPEFPGGIEALYNFMVKNLKYPKIAKENNVQGKVFVSFVVEKDGSLRNIKVSKSLSPETDAEAMRLMQISPRWIPGGLKGKPVRVQYTMPIIFRMQDQ